MLSIESLGQPVWSWLTTDIVSTRRDRLCSTSLPQKIHSKS